MIKVTEDAMNLLKNILVTVEAAPDEGLRLLPAADGQFVLAVDSTLSGDSVIEYEGFKVLLIGVEYFNILNGKTIDCDYSNDESVLFVS